MNVLHALGALGLFLIGMWLMTEGLKVAGGEALKHLLHHWINTRWRGFISGFLLTSLVQSSSAVTVATIGFVNARLMTFSQSVWVVFGSNVGTTMTAWIVTLVGFKFALASATMPLIGVGAFARVFSSSPRIQSVGIALAGFGLLFMGLEALQTSFSGLQQVSLSLPYIDSPLVTGLIFGIFLTTLTQSSSAAVAIILTAGVSGMGQLPLMAGAVMGANIGTTSTALLAIAGSTPSAKRVIAMHVLFNLVTAGVAFMLLIMVMPYIPSGWGEQTVMTITLSSFHTLFNLLGVLLMVPLEPKLSQWLLRWFRDTKTQRMFDDSLVAVPELAIDSISRHLARLYTQISNIPLTAGIAEDTFLAMREQLDQLGEFTRLTSKQTMTDSQADRVANALASQLRLLAALDAASQVHRGLASIPSPSETLINWLNVVSRARNDRDSWQDTVARYEATKHRLLRQQLVQSVSPNNEQELSTLASAMRYLRKLHEISPTLEENGT